MELILHVVIAISSVVMAGWTFMTPNRAKLKTSYTLSLLTLVTGAYMVWSLQTGMLRACISGLLFVGGTLTLTVMAQRKLAHQAIRIIDYKR